MNLNNVLHTHIDGIRCIEKFLETSQLKISFQKHHFSHFFALSQTSESGCQGVWKFKNRYVCTFCRLGCVLMMVWSWNFFLRKGMIPNKYRKAEFGVRNLTKIFFAPFKVKQLGTQNTIFWSPDSEVWESAKICQKWCFWNEFLIEMSLKTFLCI